MYNSLVSSRYARLAALALIVILILAFPLLVLLFGSFSAVNAEPTREPTVSLSFATPILVQPTLTPTATTSASPSPLATSTSTATLEPSATATLPLPPTCPPPATPEPLWVDPIISPTTALSQKLSVTLGRGRELSVAGPAGTVTLQGNFSVAQPVELEMPLLPSTSNELLVSGLVEYAPGCSYRLQTRTDRNGNPLVIVQQSSTTTPTQADPVYLQPFSQVFAMNQPGPNPTGDIWLYQGNSDVFTIVGQDQFNVNLQSADGSQKFWVLRANVLSTPAPAPAFDFGVRGRIAPLVSENVFACEATNLAILAFGKCAPLQEVSDAALIARVVVNGSTQYLGEINGKQYWLPASVVAP